MSLAFVKAQVGYVSQRGFQVYALSSPGPDLDAFGERYGVPTYAVEMPRRVTPLRDLSAVLRTTRVLREIRPEIVHAHTPKGGLLGMIAAWLAGAPVRIYHMRGLPLMGASGGKRSLLRWTERISCALSHRVICVSHSLRDAAIREGICRAEKIGVLAGGSGQGVDAERRFDPARVGAQAGREIRARYGIPEWARVLGFIGRLVRDKGVVELEVAWQRLRAEYPDLHLLLVGPFEPQDPIPADVRGRLEGDPRVHLAGMDWETPPYYAAMDLVVLPTYREGFPNVPLEAAAMGLPVVATRIPGCVDAVQDGVTGTLVPVRDTDALASAIRRYLDDPALRRDHGAAGRERVLRDFRQEVICEAMYQAYLSLLAAQGRALPHPQRMEDLTGAAQ
jgi:glycosyltransferase involved in cell wall biosynthesis